MRFGLIDIIHKDLSGLEKICRSPVSGFFCLSVSASPPLSVGLFLFGELAVEKAACQELILEREQTC